MRIGYVTWIYVVTALAAAHVGAAPAQHGPAIVPSFAQRRNNIALGKPYTYNTAPFYRLTHNDTDLTDLTDGSLSHRRNQKIWFDRKACAWQGDSVVCIRLDLGAVEPIEEAAISLLGGAEQGGLKFPRQVDLLVSRDAVEWRLAGRFRKIADDAPGPCPFGVPKEEGKAWTFPLRFTGLKCAARYVGFKIEGDTAFIASDELYVFRGKFSPREARECERFQGSFGVHEFAPDRITVYFSKPTVYVSTNIQTYQTILCSDDRGDTKPRVTLRLDLPPGVELRRHMLNVRYGGACTDDPRRRSVMVDGKPYTRYEIETRGVRLKNWGHFFWTSDWAEGRRGALRISAASGQAVQPWEQYSIEAVRIDPVPQPKRIHVSVCWMPDLFWSKWPGCLEAMKTIGVTAMPFFPRYSYRDGKLKEGIGEALRDARNMGLEIIQNESPIHRLKGLLKDNPEIGCQPPSRKNRWTCPCYRGQQYLEEVEVIAQRFAALKPDWIIYDCEAYSGYSVAVSQACTRCREAFAQSGMTDWQRFACEKGNDFYRDVDKRIQEAVPGAKYERGSYGVMPSRVYHNIWDMKLLFPDLHQFAMPSIYRFRPVEIRAAVREQRQHIQTNDIIPWLQPGNLGEMPAEHVRCMLLEACLNGCRGATYYTSNGFDAADYKALSQAIAVLCQVEDIVRDGNPLTGASCGDKTVNIGGMALADKAVLLVSDYQSADRASSTVTLPKGFAGQVKELFPGPARIVRVADGQLRVTFGPERARVYLLVR